MKITPGCQTGSQTVAAAAAVVGAAAAAAAAAVVAAVTTFSAGSFAVEGVVGASAVVADTRFGEPAFRDFVVCLQPHGYLI